MVSYRILKNSILGGADFCSVAEGGVRVVCESNYPTGEIRDIELSDPIGGQELADILNARSLESIKQASKLVYGESDFLPFAFLGHGLRAGAAVCRLVRHYSDDGIDKLIEMIQEVNYSKLEIRELLKTSKIEILDDFWGTYEQVSDALKADQTIREQLKERFKKAMPIAYGTGFLVGRNHLLTNHHVLSDPSAVGEFTAQFCYEQNSSDEETLPFEYKLDASVFKTDSDLDYTLVGVRPLNSETVSKDGMKYYRDESGKNYLTFREAGNNFGWLQMSDDYKIIAPPVCKDEVMSEAIGDFALFKETINPEILQKKLEISDLLGEPLNIIQHPKGREKEIVIYNNRVQKIYPQFIQYETDAEPGSSGSPLFNSQWQLVGLHHSALVEELGKVAGYLGTRIHHIVKDLQKSNDAKTKEFIDRFVTNPRKGTIYLLAGLKRDGVVESPVLEADQMTILGNRINKLFSGEFSKHGFELQLVPEEFRQNEDRAIEWINQQDYNVGDVALEIVTDSIPENQTVRGSAAYYFKDSLERKSHAELLLQSLLKRVPDLPDRGTKSDRATKGRRLPFCRDIFMPSLVLYVGFLTNSEDVNVIKTQSENIAQGISEGLVLWAKSVSPLNSEIALFRPTYLPRIVEA